jgi:hypothetical protein
MSRTGGHRAINRRLAVVGVVALLGAASAYAFSSGSADATDFRSLGWTWPTGVPGKPIPVSRPIEALARVNEVEVAAAREIEVVQTGDGQLRLVGVLTSRGVPCFAGFGRMIAPLKCVDALPPDVPLVIDGYGGGASPSRTDYQVVVGVARSDVARVKVTLQNGAERSVPLSSWRSFAYGATAPAPLPRSIAAYAADGSKLFEAEVAVAPPGDTAFD